MLKKYWIPGLWLLSIPLYWLAGSNPDTYAIAVRHEHPSYPVEGVLTFIVITSVESLVLYAIIRPRTYDRSWKRSAAALLLFFPWLAVCAILLMHQPPYVFMHFFWLLMVNVILGVLCIYSVVARLTRPHAP
jgi:hypothetical protein